MAYLPSVRQAAVTLQIPPLTSNRQHQIYDDDDDDNNNNKIIIIIIIHTFI